MAKPNARTFRYSDEVKLILEQYNNDFDFLVFESHLKFDEVHKQIQISEKRLHELRLEYNRLYSSITQIKQLRFYLNQLESSLQNQYEKINKEM